MWNLNEMIIAKTFFYSRLFLDCGQGILETCVRKGFLSMQSRWRFISEFVWTSLQVSDFLHCIFLQYQTKPILSFDSIGKKLYIRLDTGIYIWANGCINERPESWLLLFRLCLLRKKLGKYNECWVNPLSLILR